MSPVIEEREVTSIGAVTCRERGTPRGEEGERAEGEGGCRRVRRNAEPALRRAARFTQTSSPTVCRSRPPAPGACAVDQEKLRVDPERPVDRLGEVFGRDGILLRILG